MTNDFKKGFLTGAGGLLGVLSIPAGAYILYLLYTPAIVSLQKKEYLEYQDCYWPAFQEGLKKGKTDEMYSYTEVSKEFTDKYILKVCGELPKRWKWQ